MRQPSTAQGDPDSKWTGDGPKQTMVNAPDADILREIIELLKARVATGAATFLAIMKMPLRLPVQFFFFVQVTGKFAFASTE